VFFPIVALKDIKLIESGQLYLFILKTSSPVAGLVAIYCTSLLSSTFRDLPLTLFEL
jgi:hypothetical protein